MSTVSWWHISTRGVSIRNYIQSSLQTNFFLGCIVVDNHRLVINRNFLFIATVIWLVFSCGCTKRLSISWRRLCDHLQRLFVHVKYLGAEVHGQGAVRPAHQLCVALADGIAFLVEAHLPPDRVLHFQFESVKKHSTCYYKLRCIHFLKKGKKSNVTYKN